MINKDIHTIQGISKDMAKCKADKSLAYDARNIRITARENETLLSITNEQGTKQVVFDNNNQSFRGDFLGHCVLNDYVIVFTKDESLSKNPDFIYLVNMGQKEKTLRVLFNGELKFDLKHPIETLGVYENEDIQKIYWVDGINQTRVINFKAPEETRLKWDDNSFDFVQNLELNEEVKITKLDDAGGVFHSGVIQYAFSYFNKYGQESNIFYTSPLNYISGTLRGSSPEEVVGNSFKINIENIDSRFEFLRIYSIHRTSIDATPNVKRVSDIDLSSKILVNSYTQKTFKLSPSDILIYDKYNKKYIPLTDIDSTSGAEEYISKWNLHYNYYNEINISPDNTSINLEPDSSIIIEYNNASKELEIKNYTLNYNIYPFSIIERKQTYNIEFVDNGSQGEVIEASRLLYVGGEKLIFQTITQKDNTLFLGNATINRAIIKKDIKQKLRGGTIKFTKKLISSISNTKGHYPYNIQLDKDNNIGGFKYNEWYRFGVQFQHITGKWSEPIFINDAYNGRKYSKITNYAFPSISTLDNKEYNIYIPKANYTLNRDVIIDLLNMGYHKARGVVVFPSINDRETIAQGIVCPTVYNMKDRINNAPFVQSSWFSRPNLQYDVDKYLNEWGELSDTSPESIVHNGDYYKENILEDEVKNTILNNHIKSLTKYGAWAEFRHNKALSGNYFRNCEIQSLTINDDYPYTTGFPKTRNKFIRDNEDGWYIDQSILTFHSPEIEFNDNFNKLDTSNLKMRIIGRVNVTGNISYSDVQIEGRKVSNKSLGFVPFRPGVSNQHPQAIKSLLTVPSWVDTNAKESSTDEANYFYATYPWNKSGSISHNYKDEKETEHSVLKYNRRSNLKFSFSTEYFKEPYYLEEEGSNTKTGVTPLIIHNSDQKQLIKIPSPKYSNLGDLNYFGNVDKIITPSLSDREYFTGYTTAFNKKDGYRLMGTSAVVDTNNYEEAQTGYITAVNRTGDAFLDPISMKYKSSTHAVFALNYTTDGNQRIMPTLLGQDNTPINKVIQPKDYDYPAWVKLDESDVTSKYHINQDVVYGINPPKYGGFWLCEVYKDKVSNRFGGQTKEAFVNNEWRVAGEPVDLNYRFDTVIEYNRGDTFFQRYDCLKTYPFTLEDKNQVVDIVSFMCESRINLDGRYDKNRGQINNLAMSPTNFNLMNNVYSQSDSYFTYRGLDDEMFKLDLFPNTVTWTKEKHLGSRIDTWTNLTMANTLDLDGDKGEITSLNTFNNEIFCFQKNALSNILFNSRVQIPTSDNVPIEISNGMKVQGKRYISNTIGCNNKWSIVESPNGLYFIDNITNSINLFNGQISSLSDSLGFRHWVSNYTDTEPWNPKDFNNFRAFYDRNNNDVYFVSKEECLGFSELLNKFTSFYSYEKVPTMFNINSDFYSIHKGSNSNLKLWENFAGDYNMFYGKFQPFSITVLSNEHPTMNKIFNVVEYNGDMFDTENNYLQNETFDTIEVWNEHQKGESELKWVKGRPSNLSKRYRVWKANVPRDSRNNRMRIRNTWAGIKLSKNKANKFKMRLNDIIVSYTV